MATAQYTAHGFLKDAVMLANVADSACESGSADPIRICAFWGQIVEWALKGFLLTKGVTATELKKNYGHDLAALLCEAEARGLCVLIGSSPINAGVIRLLNVDYVRKRFDYREPGATYLVPDETLMRQVIQRLVRGLTHHLNRRSPSRKALFAS